MPKAQRGPGPFCVLWFSGLRGSRDVSFRRVPLFPWRPWTPGQQNPESLRSWFSLCLSPSCPKQATLEPRAWTPMCTQTLGPSGPYPLRACPHCPCVRSPCPV